MRDTLSSFLLVIFFFSSRRRHTRFSRDWSSDVCSSDLGALVLGACGKKEEAPAAAAGGAAPPPPQVGVVTVQPGNVGLVTELPRSEERRVGTECRAQTQPNKLLQIRTQERLRQRVKR